MGGTKRKTAKEEVPAVDLTSKKGTLSKGNVSTATPEALDGMGEFEAEEEDEFESDEEDEEEATDEEEMMDGKASFFSLFMKETIDSLLG